MFYVNVDFSFSLNYQLSEVNNVTFLDLVSCCYVLLGLLIKLLFRQISFNSGIFAVLAPGSFREGRPGRSY